MTFSYSVVGTAFKSASTQRQKSSPPSDREGPDPIYWEHGGLPCTTVSIVHFRSNVSSLTVSAAFNAALTVFAGLLIKVHRGMDGDDPTQNHLKRSLDLAITALQNLGGGVRLAKRCGRYLEALSKVAASLSKFS